MIHKVVVIKLYIRSQLCELAMDTDTSETRRTLQIMLKIPLHTVPKNQVEYHIVNLVSLRN